MPRGGKREGAGGKPKWNHGKTKTIRVPEVLADEILELARMLDEGKTIDDVTESKCVDLSGINIQILKRGPVVYLEDLLKAGFTIKPTPLMVRLMKFLEMRNF